MAVPDEVLSWDPDREPRRYANGVGHNLLELYSRLARGGLEVTAGEEIPAGTRLVVVFSKSVYRTPRLRALLRAAQRTGGRFAVIRSDAPLSWSFPVRPVVELMPTQAAVTRPWQRWLPPLPQRGLVPRRDERLGRIGSVAFKGALGTVPAELMAAEWTEELASRGIDWLLDAPADVDGEDQSWHDFADVDAVLCTRADRSGFVVERKPATRLINAWVAGCVPLADPEPGYLELGRGGRDAFFVVSAADTLATIDELNADAALLRQVEQRIRERAVEFAPEAVLERWHDMLVEAALSPDSDGLRRRSARMAGARASAAAAQLLEPVVRPSRRGIAVARVHALRWSRRAGLSG